MSRSRKSWCWSLGLALLCAASPLPAWAWGHAGHQLIGSLADEMLVGTPAAKKVAAVLGPALQNLKTAAPWPDCVRDVVFRLPDSFTYVPAKPPFHSQACVPFEGQPERKRMEDYAQRNWHNCPDVNGHKATGACHRSYHFTDVAMQHSSYSRQFIGTSNQDIVATLQAAVAVLRSGKPATGLPNLRDRKEALLLIAHLVGDLHQPLHVGAIYLRDDGTPADPDATPPPPSPVLETRGGNSLEIGGSNLHEAWDTIPSALKLGSLATGPGLKRRQALLVEARALPATAGAADSWPERWATDTVRASQAAFPGLRFTRKGATEPDHWVVQFQDATGYDRDRQALQRRQLTQAAAHLAALLRSVWP